MFNSELRLDSKEFDTLDMLAIRENEYLTFEQLYIAVWDEKDGLDRRNDARLGLENILEQVNGAGGGFMWIAYTPEKGFSFRTLWGHNKKEVAITRIVSRSESSALQV